MPASLSGSPGHRKRLRERFLRSSLEGFHDYEVVELLLTYAIPRRDVKPLAKALIKRFKGLRGICEASPEEMLEVAGCGARSAELFWLLKESASVYVNEKAASRPPVRSAADVVCFVNDHSKEYSDNGERLFALFLNSKNEILGIRAPARRGCEQRARAAQGRDGKSVRPQRPLDNIRAQGQWASRAFKG